MCNYSHDPLTITDDRDWLLRYFYVCSKQLPPLVLILYERANMLKSYFEVDLDLKR